MYKIINDRYVLYISAGGVRALQDNAVEMFYTTCVLTCT